MPPSESMSDAPDCGLRTGAAEAGAMSSNRRNAWAVACVTESLSPACKASIRAAMSAE
jgi:hypothetical protein